MVLRICKMIATFGFLTALKCIIFVFRGSAPDPTRGAYSAPPDPLAGLKGPTSKAGEEGRERGRREKKGRGTERGTGPFANSCIRPCLRTSK